MSALAPIPEFESDDGFLHAVLGLVAAGSDLQSFLRAEPEHACGEAWPGADDDAILHALLGLVRLSGLASRVADSWAVEGAEPARPAPEAPLERVEGILR